MTKVKTPYRMNIDDVPPFKVAPPSQEKPSAIEQPSSTTKKKLSYMEAREYATIEERIAQAEATLTARKAAYEDPAIATDAERLITAQTELEAAQQEVDTLIARWAELEEKKSS